ncbi:hypothetical protein F511_28781 [Dorcoceras hygrometricum]|uniref:Uncharacterized protein n=1 Tax=Dorcoceras hygrometricum TaxID=472368 RepID=A0A2Z7CRV8_9LAMI|nr:hypothetical protein F511_28781 [Dorcoceras hygrometricum]
MKKRFFPRFLSIPAFVFDDFGGAGFLVSCSIDCYSLEVVERLVEVSVKLLVYEDFWRNQIERSLIVVRFWIFSSRESLPCLPSQERSGCLGRELQRLVRTLLRYLRLEGTNGADLTALSVDMAVIDVMKSSDAILFSTADVIMSVEIVEAEYDGDVMMSGVFLWLTSSNPLRQTMSCLTVYEKLSIDTCTLFKNNTVARSDITSR